VRRFLSALLVVVIATFPAASYAQAKKAKSGGNPKYASIVVDADTGAILHQRHADKSLHPASLTKVMTLLLLFEAMEAGTVRRSDKILISQRAAAQSPSKIGLPAGSSIRVEDAILAVVTKSANDISVAIAEHLAGSESKFAQRMTARAQSIGMTKTVFRNASGLHNPQQISTARDMAILARYVIHRYPNYYHYFGTKQFTYRGKTYTNHNRLMNSYPGMDGFKTGFINASGFNLIASAKQHNRRLIGVVFGGRTWKSRNDHMAEILNASFQKKGGSAPQVEMRNAALSAPPPPPAKPVFRTQEFVTSTPSTSGQQKGDSFTSLQALSSGTQMAVPAHAAPRAPYPELQTAEADPTKEAMDQAKYAANSGEYGDVIGEGDYDTATLKRVETGLMTAAVYKGQKLPQPQAPQTSPASIEPAAYTSQSSPLESRWSIQVGAYTTQESTTQALQQTLQQLPTEFQHAQGLIVPLSTPQGVLYRARIGNLSQTESVALCGRFKDCIAIPPQ